MKNDRSIMIQSRSLRKVFRAGFWGRRIVAVEGIDLDVHEGEIFGFLGPNGAGKTTTIKMLMGLIRPTTGQAWIMGRECGDVRVRERIGFLPEQPYFYEYLTACEFLKFYGTLFGIPKGSLRSRAEALLEIVGLRGSGDLQLRRFSKGMLQRIGIAQALLNEPDLVILDEPMSGLDPIGRKEVRDIILKMRESGKTVFFSTHILSDVEMICDRVAIVVHGKMRQMGRMEEVLTNTVRTVEVTLRSLDQEAMERLKPFSQTVVARGEQTMFIVDNESMVDAMLRELSNTKGRIVSIIPQKMSLEDLFIREVQREKE